MITIQAQIPDYLYQRVERLAQKENISIDMILAMALSGHLAAWLTQQYLEDKAQQISWRGFQEGLAKVPDAEPEDPDRLDR